MSGRGSTRFAARLLCAAAVAVIAPAEALAQATAPASPPPSDPAQLDPTAPLDPMPDLGVAWPDLNEKDQVVAPLPESPQAEPVTAPIAEAASDEGTSERKYTIAIDGLAAIGN